MNLTSYKQTAKEQYPSLLHTDIDRIIAYVTEVPLLELFLNNEYELTVIESATMDDFLKRRAENEPLQYIFGEAAFRNFIFSVGEGVLIPRPETEMLVDIAIALLPENQHLGEAKDVIMEGRACRARTCADKIQNNTEKHTGLVKVCDIGTGSGSIAISIAMEKQDSEVTALDISEKALEFTRRNIEKYSIKNITLLHSNIFNSLKEQKFHLITANLPYIAQNIYNNLDCEVRKFEPKTALLSGNDGLDLIRRTALEAPAFLYPNGSIIFEFSPEQKNAMIAILEENNYHNIKIINDLSNRPRFALGTTA